MTFIFIAYDALQQIYDKFYRFGIDAETSKESHFQKPLHFSH
jgi:hypothetical protein